MLLFITITSSCLPSLIPALSCNLHSSIPACFFSSSLLTLLLSLSSLLWAFFLLCSSLHLSHVWLIVCSGKADGRWVRDCPCQPLTLGPIQAAEMIDVKSNFKHPQFNSGRQTESGGQRLATQLGQPDKPYSWSLPAGVFVCMLLLVCVAILLEAA